MSNALVAIVAATALSRHPNAPHPIGLLRPPGHCQAPDARQRSEAPAIWLTCPPLDALYTFISIVTEP